VLEQISEMKTAIGREAALIKRWMDARIFNSQSRDQRIFVLDNFLPEEEFKAIQKLAMDNQEVFFRKNSAIRSGAALGLHELRESPCSGVVDALVNESFLQRVRERTGIEDMQYIPAEDRNQISLLFYTAAGDGIDWHFDGNIYLGQRWTTLFTLFENTHDENTKLEAEVDGKVVTFKRKGIENTLVLLQGDQVKHRVRPMAEGEQRLVVNLVLSPTPEVTNNPALRFYQAMVNYVFYGKTNR
jgi:hypothetical protein